MPETVVRAVAAAPYSTIRNILLGAWGYNAGHFTDLNGDNLVNASDLALLLGQWGSVK